MGVLKRQPVQKEQKMQHILLHPVKQKVLWNMLPDTSCCKTGKLSLCIGMLVLIKKNIATECCVMNRVQATVVGWMMFHVKCDDVEFPVADVLFVKLSNCFGTHQD